MSAAGSLDLRVPIGALFVTLGAIIGGVGVATMDDVARYERSGGININLWWGLVMVAFGAVMLLLSRRRRLAAPSTSAEGLAIEQIEHGTGLERDS